MKLGDIYVTNFTRSNAEVVDIDGDIVVVKIGLTTKDWNKSDMETWIERGIKQNGTDPNDIEKWIKLIN